MSRRTAGRFGKMPTTSVRRLISLFRRSWPRPPELGVHLLWRRLLVDGAYHGGHPGLGASGNPRQQVRHKVRATSLPTRTGEHCRMASVSPRCASEITSSTPLRPRADSERRNASQNTPSSLVPIHTNDLPSALSVPRSPQPRSR